MSLQFGKIDRPHPAAHPAAIVISSSNHTTAKGLFYDDSAAI
jgi:hypothetical protein